MALNINTITKIFNTGFTRVAPTPTTTNQISWNSLGSVGSTTLLVDSKALITNKAIQQEYTGVLDAMFKSRLGYYQSVDKIAYSDKVLEILDQLIDELVNAIAADEPFTPAILSTEPNAMEALQELKTFNHRCDVYRYDRVMLPKLLTYGEFFLGTSVKVGEGITSLNDMIEGQRIIPLYDGFKVEEYIGYLSDFEGQSYINQFGNSDKVRIDRNLLTHFAVSPRRYPLKDENIPALLHSGYSVLLGQSVMYPALSRLFKLMQLENAADVHALSQVSAERLVGVPVSANVKPTDYPELVRTYIDFLTPIMGTSTGNKTDINSLTANTNAFTVLPYPQGQGKPEAIDFPKTDLSIFENRINALDSAVDKAIGVDNADGSRSQVYAAKARLVKRLKDVLDARRFGWKEIYLRHLLFKGIYINPENFDVQMRALPDYEVFAEAEMAAHMVESMRAVFGFATDVRDMNLFKKINVDCLNNFFRTFMGNRFQELDGLFEQPIDQESEEGTEGNDLPSMPPANIPPMDMPTELPTDDIDIEQTTEPEPEPEPAPTEVEPPEAAASEPIEPFTGPEA